MILALLFLLLPTLAAYPALDRLEIGSRLLKVSLAWFLGQSLAVVAVLLAACALSPFAEGVLFHATSIYLLLLAGWISRRWGEISRSLRAGSARSRWQAVFVGWCALCAYAIYAPHLWNQAGLLMRSHVYWDFPLHFPIIQSFAQGDNFPPQSEAFSGMPLAYHYFFDLLCAIYCSLGLDLAGGINLASMASLLFLLLLLGGMAEELLGSLAAGWIAGILSLTSSSMRFLNELELAAESGIRAAILYPFEPWIHGYINSLLPGNPAGYNGTMFNVFYFIVERQLVFGGGLLLGALIVIYRLDRLGPERALVAGALFGSLFQWHLFITALIGASLSYLLLFAPARRECALCLAAYCAVCLAHVAYFGKIAANPEWFLPHTSDVPRISFEFSTNEGYPVTPLNMLKYWGFSYGVKPLFLLAGLAMLRRRDRRLFQCVLSVVLPAFVLINTVQISPVSIYENHKWLKPMNLLIDLMCGLALAELIRLGGALRWAGCAASLLLLTLSGLIELVPFLKPNYFYAEAAYPSEIVAAIRARSEPRDIFLARNGIDVFLAGRRLYLEFSGDTDLGYRPYYSFGLNKQTRERKIYQIYSAYSTRELCETARAEGIDFIEFSPDMQSTPAYKFLATWPGFEAFSDRLGILFRYIDLKGCDRIYGQ